MENNPVAIVLGGTVPHCYLIQLLKKRGYHTVLVDYTQNPPAKEFADEHIKESTLDRDAVLSIARKRDAQLVISTNVDQAKNKKKHDAILDHIRIPRITHNPDEHVKAKSIQNHLP